MGAFSLLFISFFALSNTSTCPSIQNTLNQEIYQIITTNFDTPKNENICRSLRESEHQGPEYKIKKITEDINLYKNLSENELSTLFYSKDEIKVEESQKPVPLELIDLFNNLQILIFNDYPIELRLCLDCHSFLAVYNEKAVYMPQKQLDEIYTNTTYENPLNVLAYIFAHEISHFLQNSYSLRSNNYTPSNLLYLPTANANQLVAITSILQAHFLHTDLHSEVDHYAFQIYIKAGYTNTNDILKWYFETSLSISENLESNSDFSYLMDLNFRRIQIENLIRSSNEH